MNLPALYIFLRNILDRENGQDLVEYALIMAMISLGTITGMSNLAGGINNEFSAVATVLTTST
jgi:pilus assembly protein Flp/PilA